jgi:hypothetical protein
MCAEPARRRRLRRSAAAHVSRCRSSEDGAALTSGDTAENSLDLQARCPLLLIAVRPRSLECALSVPSQARGPHHICAHDDLNQAAPAGAEDTTRGPRPSTCTRQENDGDHHSTTRTPPWHRRIAAPGRRCAPAGIRPEPATGRGTGQNPGRIPRLRRVLEEPVVEADELIPNWHMLDEPVARQGVEDKGE